MCCKQNFCEHDFGVFSCELWRGYPSSLGISRFCFKSTMFQLRSCLLTWLPFPEVPLPKAGPAVLPGSRVQGLSLSSPSNPVPGSRYSFLQNATFSLPLQADFSWIPLAVCGWPFSAEALRTGWEGAEGRVLESIQMLLRHLHSFFMPRFPHVSQ